MQLLSKMSELAPSVWNQAIQMPSQMERTMDSVTEWCICGKCREMPVEAEKTFVAKIMKETMNIQILNG